MEICRKPREVLLRQHLTATLATANQRLAQAGFTLACLPYEAWFSLDAIARTLGRMLFTHKRLLEWNPSGEAARNNRTDFAATLRAMWIAPLIAITTTLYLLLFNTAALAVADPSCCCGLAHP